MTSFEIFALKNRMLFYNMLTTLIGIWLIIVLSIRSISPPFYEIADVAHRINMISIPVFLGFIFIIQLVYEMPIRKYIDKKFSKNNKTFGINTKAKQRVLNAPFFIIGLDLSVWIISAIVYTILYKKFTNIELAAYRVFFQNILVGLISVTAVFFLLEQILQKSLIPHCFPDGELYATPRTGRIRIRTRFTAFIFAVNLIPFFALLVLVQGTYNTPIATTILLEHVRTSIITCSLISISVGICLTILLSLNFSRPINDIIFALKKIHEGYLNSRVTVTTNDEIGYAGDVINEMTEGLKERARMKQSLELAKEVQLRLLPQNSPKIGGLDIAGFSLYCDETGGDYYDFLNLKNPATEKIGIVIGDVSDHGVHSALIMSTARAFIRLRSSKFDSLINIVSDVNYHLTIDIEDGGQFMTLFFLSLDLETGVMNWVRAGHEPAIFYHPIEDKIEELKGNGIPLGIDEKYRFSLNEKMGLTKGQIIVLSTDGIWEARNKNGEFFGKDRYYNIIRKNANLDSRSMIDMVVGQVKEFQNGAKIEDDITMVVIKITKDL